MSLFSGIANFLAKTLLKKQVEQLVKQEFEGLQAQVAALQKQVNNAADLHVDLKTKYDAAIVDNGNKEQAIAALQADVATLTAQLAAAGNSATTAEELAAVAAATATLQTMTQKLADSVAVNAAAN